MIVKLPDLLTIQEKNAGKQRNIGLVSSDR